MRAWPKACVVGAPLAFGLLLQGCAAGGGSGGSLGAGAGGSRNAGGAPNLGNDLVLPPGTDRGTLLPARIRRLTNAEYQASVSELFGAAAADITSSFVPDSRQSGFTVNDAQRVDPVYAQQLAEAASQLAADVRLQAVAFAPCVDAGAGAEACASAFIQRFGEQVYRRPLATEEASQLLTVYRTGAEGATYEDGVELVARAMLQSAAFLYLTELGEGTGASVKLTPRELASSISYLIQGRPPKAELISDAESGALESVEGRHAAASQLLLQAAPDRLVRVIREWLGTDRIAETAKDSNVYASFAAVRGAMEQETTEFIQVLLAQKKGTLAELLAADWTMANSALATVYDTTGAVDGAFSEVAVPNRLGMLHQGAFLSVFAHAHETAPVVRGVAVMRRVACLPVPDPVSLDGAVVPPAPDLTKTTRERFSVHSADPKCAACHSQIDSFGFAFEHLDGMGQHRKFDNGKTVDSNVVIAGTDFDGSYADSNRLVQAMSESTRVRECFARHVFRALAGGSDAAIQPSEDQFVSHWRSVPSPAPGASVAVPSASEGNIKETMLAYVSSPTFLYRRAQ